MTAADITAIYDAMLNGDLRYLGYSDLNGDGVVTAADITMLYTYILQQ